MGYYSLFNFRNQQPLALMAFEGGMIYGFYQSEIVDPAIPGFAYQGFFVVRPKVSHGFVELEGIDFNFDLRTASTIDITTTGSTDERFAATLTHRATGETEQIFATRSSTASQPTDPKRFAGSYSVQARSLSNSSEGTASVDASGAVKVTLSTTCTVQAQLNPRSLGNLYDATAQFSSNCGADAGGYTGHGFQSFLTGVVYLLLTTPSGGGALLLLAPA